MRDVNDRAVRSGREKRAILLTGRSPQSAKVFDFDELQHAVDFEEVGGEVCGDTPLV